MLSIFNLLQNTNIAKKLFLHAALVDYTKSDQLRKYLNCQKEYNLSFLINDQVQYFAQFNSIYNDNDKYLIATKIERFIENILDEVIKEIKNIKDFKKTLLKYPVIGMYLGEESGNFFEIYRVAESHLVDNMFYSFNEKLKNEIHTFLKIDNKYKNKDSFYFF